jgi:hypothetical protein
MIACEGCGKPLPAYSRSNRRFHGDACRSLAARRRRRDRAERQFAQSADEQALREAVEKSTSELRLLGSLARAAHGGNVRANIWLLQELHGYGGGRGDEDAPPTLEQADQLAALRALHRRLREGAG